MPGIETLYYIVLISAFVLSIIKWKVLSRADKFIGWLLIATVAEELAAYVGIKEYGTNYPTFHFYSPIEFLLISLYFNETLVSFKKHNLGLYIGLIGIVISVLNTLFLQPLKTFNTNYMLFEGAIVIIYCLLSFFQILTDEERSPFQFAHFWFTILFILYWSSTITGWGIFKFLTGEKRVHEVFGVVLHISNISFYAGISVVLLQYKKLIPSGAR